MLLLLLGCLDAILEAPYVLTTGLGEARGLSPTVHRTMLVASSTGVLEVSGSGARTLLTSQPARAVASHAQHIYLLTDDSLLWGELPPSGEPLGALSAVPISGAVDIQAWCDETVLIAGDFGLKIWSRTTSTLRDHPTPLPPLRAVSLSLQAPCTVVNVISEDALLVVGETVTRHSLTAPRAATPDRHGNTWVVHGEPPVLSRLSGGVLEERARYLGDPRDVHFGNGEMFSADNIYIADGGGSLDYARFSP